MPPIDKDVLGATHIVVSITGLRDAAGWLRSLATSHLAVTSSFINKKNGRFGFFLNRRKTAEWYFRAAKRSPRTEILRSSLTGTKTQRSIVAKTKMC